jgi:hypothetical protein
VFSRLFQDTTICVSNGDAISLIQRVAITNPAYRPNGSICGDARHRLDSGRVFAPGGPFSSTLSQAGVDHWAVTMTAGSSININGKAVNCSKNVLLENLAPGLETGDLTIASDLPDRALLDREIGSFELTSTSAGNLTLEGRGKGHYADRAIALALGYQKTTHLENRTMFFGYKATARGRSYRAARWQEQSGRAGYLRIVCALESCAIPRKMNRDRGDWFFIADCGE